MNANPRILLACAAALALSGCASPGPAVPPPTPVASPVPSADSAASPVPSADSAGSPVPPAAFGGTDRSWIEINIAMDEELLPLLSLAATNSADSAVQQLAAQVEAAVEEELGTLRQLHAEAGLPAENPHKGMPMPGMVMPSQVAAAGGQRGSRFDRTLRECLRAHLEQSHQLAGSERTAGSEPRTVALAERIFTSREKFLQSLD